MTSVVFDSECQVYSNFLVFIWWPTRMNLVLERIVIVQPGNIQLSGVFPLSVPSVFI
jgi:hypothetical protein